MSMELVISSDLVPLIPSCMSAAVPQAGAAGTLTFDPQNAFGDSPFEATTGKVVLLRRGKVTFDTKVRNVESAGHAVAVIIIDSADEHAINVNIRNSAGDLHAPSLLLAGVDRAHGERLIEAAQGRAISATVRAAASPDHLEFGRALVRDGTAPPPAPPHTHPRDELGRTPAMLAAALDNVAHLSALLDGISAEQLLHIDREGDSALNHAARNGHVAVGRLLLEGAVRVMGSAAALAETRNRAGYTALGLAAEYGRDPFVRLLLQHGANPQEGVHHAATKGWHIVVRTLLSAGGDATRANARGETAVDLAHGLAREYLADPLSTELRALFGGEVDLPAVTARVRDALAADLGADAEVVSVTPTRNQQLGEAFVAALKKLRAGDGADTGVMRRAWPTIRFLWHGCGAGLLETLLHDGFKTSFSSLSFNVYGAGIYFAVDARLATFFLTTDAKTGARTPPDADGCYTLILAAVLLGRTGAREPLLYGSESEKGEMEGALKHPANRNPPVGCQSATGSKLKEVVLYDNGCAFPAFTVRFRLRADAPPLPDPYDEDFARDGAYLRPLTTAPRGFVEWRTTQGAVTSLDASELALQQDAPLVGGWDVKEYSERSARESAAEREHEGRVAALRGTVSRLRRRLRLTMALAAVGWLGLAIALVQPFLGLGRRRRSRT